ncbi:MAG TPA: Trm112 family protein [Fimbriimonadaceae bacterium]|nr:Trm112 family protein [Fimbriimonadaceae bacterium]
MDDDLLELLACPRCDARPPLQERDGTLVCTVCGRSYAIVDGVPQLTIEDATPLEEDDD